MLIFLLTFQNYHPIIDIYYPNMGCGTSGGAKNTVPIGNSLMHLLQTGQNDLLLKKIQAEGPDIFKMRLNFLGDTIAHFACHRNNYQLVQLLKNQGADFSIPNQNGLTPADLTEDPEILKLLGVPPKANTLTSSTEEASTLIKKTEEQITNIKQQTKFSNLINKPNQRTTLPRKQISRTSDSRQAILYSIDEEGNGEDEDKRRMGKQSMLTQFVKNNLENKSIPAS